MKGIFPLAAAFLLLAPLWAGAETVNRIAAVVNDEIITTHQLEQALKPELPETGELPPGQLEKLRQEVLSGLIEEALIGQRTGELGLKVEEDELEAAIQDVQRQNRLTRGQLEEALQQQGMSFAEYRENLRRQILRYKLIGREVQSKIEVTNQEIRDYFRQNIETYREPARVRLSRLSFFIPPRTAAAEVETLRRSAEQALARLKAGEEFETVLLSYTADRTAEGGDMGAFTEGQLTSSFARAIRDLQQGEVSSLIETGEGFHILLVTERVPEKFRQFDTVKEEIRKALHERKTEERFREWAAGLHKGAYIDVRI